MYLGQAVSRNSTQTLYGQKTLIELSKFEEDPETGRMDGPEDGLVIALGLASIGYFKYGRHAHTILEDVPTAERQTYEGVNLMFYTFDDLMERLKKPEPFSMFPSMLSKGIH